MNKTNEGANLRRRFLLTTARVPSEIFSPNKIEADVLDGWDKQVARSEKKPSVIQFSESPQPNVRYYLKVFGLLGGREQRKASTTLVQLSQAS